MSPDKTTLDNLRIEREPSGKKPAGSNGSNRPKWPFYTLLVLVVLLLLGWLWKQNQRLPVKTVVARQTASEGDYTVLNASGYVTARKLATVSSKVTGKVIEVLIEEGMTVKAGQILARLDDSNVVVNLRLAQAQAKSSHAALEETRVRLVEAQGELTRVSNLNQNKIATASDLDHAQASVNAYKARLVQQDADTETAARQVDLWNQQMDDMVIRAPFTGVVVAKNAQPGEMISPISAGGGFTRTGICTLVDMESLEIEVDVNEAYIQRVEAGGRIVASLDAYPEWSIPGKVIAIIPTADRQKATVKVRVGFDKLDARILPDMGVKVAFKGARSSITGGVTIPKTTLKKQEGRDFVWIVNSNKLERRAVTPGPATGDETVITSGLSGGEKVVLRGPDKMAEGMRVVEEAP
jgi:RND family efflux transporter MFP subunit